MLITRSTLALLSALLSALLAAADSAGSTFERPIPVLGVASIFHAGYLLRCIRSIDYPVDVLVVIHNGEDAQVAAAIATLQLERPTMWVVRVPENSGCAGGWNRILAADADAPWWLVVNDDIAFPPGALATLAASVWRRVVEEPNQGHFKFWYQHHATGWSCFALTSRAVREVGTFDENVYPVYFEDQVPISGSRNERVTRGGHATRPHAPLACPRLCRTTSGDSSEPA